MDSKELAESIANHLAFHLQRETAVASMRKVYDYALFPPGKLFRSKTAWALAYDLARDLNRSVNGHHALFASFLEFHHGYTLIHDDLPCMDNDSWRRGKLTTHKVWGEWQALLAGDGLHGASYRLLSRINSPKLPQLFHLVTWALGPKGLIQGQALDLDEKNEDFPSILRTHELKTGRLIQLSLVGSFLLIEKLKDPLPLYRTLLDLAKLGSHIGLVFQLLDDLTEFAQNDEYRGHETVVNPWPVFHRQILAQLELKIKHIWTLMHKYHLKATSEILQGHYENILAQIKSNRKNIEKKFNKYQVEMDLNPVVLLLERICHGN